MAIISHKHKFIFIKTRKTAGTSVEIALSSVCGPDDIISPISAEDEVVRKSLGYGGPQNCWKPDSEMTLRDKLNRTFRGKRPKLYRNHMSAREIKELTGDEVWSSYFKFTIERNPYDKVISNYHWRVYRNKTSYKDFDAFIAARDYLSARCFDLYTIDGKIAVDRIIRFENLLEDFNSVCETLGIPPFKEIPRVKSISRKDKRHYRELLTESAAEQIAADFRDEIELMDYRF